MSFDRFLTESHCIAHASGTTVVTPLDKGARMEKERESVLSTAKDAIVDTAKAGLGVAATGLEVTKDAAVTAGTAVTEAVSSLAKKAKKAIRRKPRAKRAAPKNKAKPKKKSAAKKATASIKRTGARKTARKTASRNKSSTAASS